MNTPRAAVLVLALGMPLLASCQRGSSPPAPSASQPAASTQPQTVLGRTVDNALRKARLELETANLDIGDGLDIHVGDGQRHFRIGGTGSRSKAQITPQGELLVDGKPQATTPEQRALLLDYRRQLITIAETGMALGVQGADLAGKAMLETVSGLLHGDADAAGKRIEAEGEQLKSRAKQICTQLPPLLGSQQRLAASLPAFAPYARMTQSDIDDCMKGDGASVTASRDGIRQEVRQEIRDRIRGSIQAGTHAAATDADSKDTDRKPVSVPAR